jgi:pimeloyl-ACP methyl ester carboxylesterase
MHRLESNGTELAYEVRGRGQPVLFVHAGPFAEWYLPLIERLPVRAVLLRDRGPGPLTIAGDAGSCLALMDHLGWRQAHLVGHSYGALVALQLALAAPVRVRSLVLLEPAALGVSSSERVAAAVRPVVEAYRRGDAATAMDLFLRAACGAGYRADLEKALPGACTTAVERADLFFRAELPAVRAWTFEPALAGRITQPILNGRGADTAERFVEASDLVQTWFPRAERFVVPDAGHLLLLQQPDLLARRIGDFFDRHPIDPAPDLAPDPG